VRAWLACLLLVGCGHLGRSAEATRPLAALRGVPVMPIAPDRELATFVRAFARVPIRMYPADADPALREELTRGSLADRQEAALRRRAPWMLIWDGSVVRLLAAFDGREAFRADAGSPKAAADAVRGAIGPASGFDGAPLGPAEVRVAPASEIAALRDALFVPAETPYGEAADALSARYAADPGPAAHRVLQRALLREPPDPAADAAVRALEPDGESELLALAVRARSEGARGLEELVRRELIRLFPDRLEYRADLADLLGDDGRATDAITLCRTGLGAVSDEETARYLDLPPNSRPDAVPRALPWADLRYGLGFWLAQRGDPVAALLAYEGAITVFDALGRNGELADVANAAGAALVESGQAIAAVPMFRRSLRLREREADPCRRAVVLHNLGRALSESRRGDEARASYREASGVYRACGDPLAAAESLSEMLGAPQQGPSPQPVAAVRADVEALVLDLPAEEANEARANIAFAAGSALWEAGEPEASLAAYADAEALYRMLGDDVSLGQTFYARAVPLLALLRIEEAHASLVDAGRIAVEQGDSESILAIREQLLAIRALLADARRPVPELPADLRPWLLE
jgi:tetratricopeptide (TPR) repeat protein